MTEFWLISAPNDRSNQQTWERMQAVTTKSNLSNNFKFAIPDIKVGNLDLMITLTDELGKLDIYTESVLKKIAQYTAETMEDSKDRIQENLLANGVDLVTYVTRFQWDMAKYPIKQSLVNLIEVISKQISQIESDFKSRSLSYNNLKGNLQSKEKKAVTNYGTWLKTYESLTDLVVPQSTKYGLPVNFQAVLLQPSKKQYKRLREVLNAVFKHLDGTAATSVVDYGMEIPGLNIGNQEYYSYVYFKIDLNMIDH
ncbi:VTC1A ATPase, partial [Polypterus senegalus]